ncbi:MAG: hypothetical protein OEL83_19350 [Desulforhopalus sp.]|nr:hypothetical protein [Desulforhopalus sp.]
MNSVTVNIRKEESTDSAIIIEAIQGSYVCVEDIANNHDHFTDWTDISEAQREEIDLAVTELHRAAGVLQELIKATSVSSVG